MVIILTRSLQRVLKIKIQDESLIYFLIKNTQIQIMPCESTADEAFIEWSHHRISSTDSKVRSTLTMSVGERVNRSQIE